MAIYRLVYIVIRVVMGVVSMIANLLTLFCALRKRSLRSAANLLVASLAVTDFLRGTSIAIVMPTTYYFTTTWYVHHPLCLTGICTEATTLQLQFVTFAMLAFERRNSLLFRLNRCEKWSVKSVLIILISMWVLVIVYNVSVTMVVSDVPEGTPCIFRYYYPMIFAYISIVSFFVTCITITFGYGHIAWVAYKSRCQVATSQSAAEQVRRKKDMAITKMMGMVVGIFFILYCPFFISAMTLSLRNFPLLNQLTVLLYDIIFWINPVIYAWRDKGFRMAFREILPAQFGRCCCLFGGANAAVTPAPMELQLAVIEPAASSRPSTRPTLVARDP